jgi:hypothetical protein
MFGSCSKDLEAKVVGNALVVSFMTADPPRVWRADMSGLSSATLELREGTPGKFRLVMRASGGKEEDISTFTDKAAATDALRAVTNAMLRGDGGSVSVSSSGPQAAGSGGVGFLKVVLWIIAIAVVGFIGLQVMWVMGGVGPRHMAAKIPTDIKEGTAVPADKIFGGK